MATRYKKVENSEFLKIMREKFEDRVVSAREFWEYRTEVGISPLSWDKVNTFKAGRGK